MKYDEDKVAELTLASLKIVVLSCEVLVKDAAAPLPG